MAFAGYGGETGLVGTLLVGLGWAAIVQGRHFGGGLCFPHCAKYWLAGPRGFRNGMRDLIRFR
jgi:hypothetical protein